MFLFIYEYNVFFVSKHKYIKLQVSLTALTKNHLQQDCNKYKIICMCNAFYEKKCIDKFSLMYKKNH